MKFCDVRTTYEYYKSLGHKDLQYNQLYDLLLDNFLKEFPDNHPHKARSINQLMSERHWYNLGCPYYKIYPAVIDQFIKTDINIDAALLKPPHSSFVIKLPEEPILSFRDKDRNYYVRTILVYHAAEEYKTSRFSGLEKTKDQEALMLWVDTNESFEDKTPILYFHRAIFPREEEIKTIDECFEPIADVGHEDTGAIIPASIVEAVLRLTVGVCFLATGSHKILEYDVLKKHLAQYRRLHEENQKRKELEKKAKRLGKFGWNIGIDKEGRHLSLPRGVTYAEAIRNAGGRELLYQHVRGGHWHKIRYGEKHSKVKVVWIDATKVRPDLPPKPINC